MRPGLARASWSPRPRALATNPRGAGRPAAASDCIAGRFCCFCRLSGKWKFPLEMEISEISWKFPTPVFHFQEKALPYGRPKHGCTEAAPNTRDAEASGRPESFFFVTCGASSGTASASDRRGCDPPPSETPTASEKPIEPDKAQYHWRVMDLYHR